MKKNLKNMSLLMLLASSPAALMGVGARAVEYKFEAPVEAPGAAGAKGGMTAAEMANIAPLSAGKYASTFETGTSQNAKLNAAEQAKQGVQFKAPAGYGDYMTGPAVGLKSNAMNQLAIIPGQGVRDLLNVSEVQNPNMINSVQQLSIPTPETYLQQAGRALSSVKNAAYNVASAAYHTPGEVVGALGGNKQFMTAARQNIRTAAENARGDVSMTGNLFSNEAFTGTGSNASYANLPVRMLDSSLTAIQNLPSTIGGRLSAAKASVMKFLQGKDTSQLSTADKNTINNEVQNQAASGATPTTTYQNMMNWLNSWWTTNKPVETSNVVPTEIVNPLSPTSTIAQPIGNLNSLV